MMPTRSPAATPLAIRPLASRETSARKSVARMSCHWPAASSRENRAGLDALAAWRKTRSVTFVSGGTVTRGGTLISRTIAPLISIDPLGGTTNSSMRPPQGVFHFTYWRVTLRSWPPDPPLGDAVGALPRPSGRAIEWGTMHTPTPGQQPGPQRRTAAWRRGSRGLTGVSETGTFREHLRLGRKG